MKFERVVRFDRGRDCVQFECIHGSEKCKPGAGGSHGISGLRIGFYAKGVGGAVQFTLNTGWKPLKIKRDPISNTMFDLNPGKYYPVPYDLGYHAKEAQYDGQEVSEQYCEWTDGPCYYDGSGLNAYDAWYTLINGGDEELWRFLEAYYCHIFVNGEYPKVYEYPMKRRDGVV